MPQPVRPPPDVRRIVRDAHAARARYIGALLRRAARGLRRALATPRRDPPSGAMRASGADAMQFGLRIPPGAPAAACRTAAPSRTCRRGHAPAGAAWFGALLRRLREREEFLNLGPRERRDAGLTGYDVRMLARKPLWRPWMGASPRGGRRPADEEAR